MWPGRPRPCLGGVTHRYHKGHPVSAGILPADISTMVCNENGVKSQFDKCKKRQGYHGYKSYFIMRTIPMLICNANSLQPSKLTCSTLLKDVATPQVNVSGTSSLIWFIVQHHWARYSGLHSVNTLYFVSHPNSCIVANILVMTVVIVNIYINHFI